MKRFLLITLSVLLVLSTVGCSNSNSNIGNNENITSETIDINLKPVSEKTELSGTYITEGINFGKSRWKKEFILNEDGTYNEHMYGSNWEDNTEGIWEKVNDTIIRCKENGRDYWNNWKIHKEFDFIYRCDHNGTAHIPEDIVRGEFFSDEYGFHIDGTYGHNGALGTYAWIDDNIIKVSVKGNRDNTVSATEYYCLDDEGYLISEVYARKKETVYGTTKTMTVAINPYFEPFSYYDENGKLLGFDIELIELIANKLGLKIEYKEFDFRELPLALTNNYAHIAIGGIEKDCFADKSIEYTSEYVTYKADKDIQCSFMLLKDSEITEYINNIFLELKKTGEIEKLYDKYSINAIQEIIDGSSNNNSSDKNTSNQSNININSKPNNTNSTTSSKPSTSHTHSYSKATCTNPATCSCGATSGSALGHTWKSANCKTPKTCSTCGKTEGTKANHTYKNEKCTLCGEKSANYPKASDIKLEYPNKLVYESEFKVLSYSISNMDGYYEGKAKISIKMQIVDIKNNNDHSEYFGVKYYDGNGNDITKWKPYDSQYITSGSVMSHLETGDICTSEFEIPANCRKIVLISER